jgi:hypothetical protein
MHRPRTIVEAATVICSTDNRASEVAAAQSHSASAKIAAQISILARAGRDL